MTVGRVLFVDRAQRDLRLRSRGRFYQTGRHSRTGLARSRSSTDEVVGGYRQPRRDDEFALLNDVFHFHPLSVEDARSALQFPKVEQYPTTCTWFSMGSTVRPRRRAGLRRETLTSSSDVTSWSRCTMGRRAASSGCGRLQSVRAAAQRRPGVAVASHRRLDGRQLSADDRGA